LTNLVLRIDAEAHYQAQHPWLVTPSETVAFGTDRQVVVRFAVAAVLVRDHVIDLPSGIEMVATDMALAARPCANDVAGDSAEGNSRPLVLRGLRASEDAPDIGRFHGSRSLVDISLTPSYVQRRGSVAGAGHVHCNTLLGRGPLTEDPEIDAMP
jgi:hypothetical protein